MIPIRREWSLTPNLLAADITQMKRGIELKGQKRSSISACLPLIFAVLMVSTVLATFTHAQSGTAAGPQSDRMPLLMPDDFSVLHLLEESS